MMHKPLNRLETSIGYMDCCQFTYSQRHSTQHLRIYCIRQRIQDKIVLVTILKFWNYPTEIWIDFTNLMDILDD